MLLQVLLLRLVLLGLVLRLVLMLNMSVTDGHVRRHVRLRSWRWHRRRGCGGTSAQRGNRGLWWSWNRHVQCR